MSMEVSIILLCYYISFMFGILQFFVKRLHVPLLDLALYVPWLATFIPSATVFKPIGVFMFQTGGTAIAIGFFMLLFSSFSVMMLGSALAQYLHMRTKPLP